MPAATDNEGVLTLYLGFGFCHPKIVSKRKGGHPSDARPIIAIALIDYERKACTARKGRLTPLPIKRNVRFDGEERFQPIGKRYHDRFVVPVINDWFLTEGAVAIGECAPVLEAHTAAE